MVCAPCIAHPAGLRKLEAPCWCHLEPGKEAAASISGRGKGARAIRKARKFDQSRGEDTPYHMLHIRKLRGNQHHLRAPINGQILVGVPLLLVSLSFLLC